MTGRMRTRSPTITNGAVTYRAALVVLSRARVVTGTTGESGGTVGKHVTECSELGHLKPWRLIMLSYNILYNRGPLQVEQYRPYPSSSLLADGDGIADLIYFTLIGEPSAFEYCTRLPLPTSFRFSAISSASSRQTWTR